MTKLDSIFYCDRFPLERRSIAKLKEMGEIFAEILAVFIGDKIKGIVTDAVDDFSYYLVHGCQPNFD